MNDLLVAGIDYLTLSAKIETISRLWGELDTLVTLYHNEGHKPKKLKEFDYVGYRIGNLAFFQNHNWGYIRANGDASSVLFESDKGYDVRCTRIDLAVTTIDEPRDVPGTNGMMKVTVGDLVTASAEANNNCPAPDHRKSPKGESVYIGSWLNDRFMRVYNKHLRDPLDGWPEHTWRWELELKSPRSGPIYGQLKQMEASERPTEILHFVTDYCDERGIYHPFSTRRVSRLQDTQTRKHTPIERKLLWIEQAVQPTAKLLIDKGYAMEFIKAIGAAGSPILAKAIVEAIRKLGQ